MSSSYSQCYSCASTTVGVESYLSATRWWRLNQTLCTMDGSRGPKHLYEPARQAVIQMDRSGYVGPSLWDRRLNEELVNS